MRAKTGKFLPSERLYDSMVGGYESVRDWSESLLAENIRKLFFTRFIFYMESELNPDEFPLRRLGIGLGRLLDGTVLRVLKKR